MRSISINEQKNIVGGKLKCSACGQTWRNRIHYLFHAGVHNLAHILEGIWFTVN